jgi:endoglucanase
MRFSFAANAWSFRMVFALGLIVGACSFLILPTNAEAKGVCYRGVNLSGAEYGDADGIYGTNFIYPSEETVGYFAKKGMTIIRLPFLWHRLQLVLGGGLDSQELDRLKASVELIRSYDMKVILDPHNFGYYAGKRMMTKDVTARDFADFWIRLALEFADDDDVLFGLMNEPYDIPAEDWLVAANQAIAGIRATGARNMILVPGTHWSGASSWLEDLPGGNNSKVMGHVSDPANNFIYEFHQYLDDDLSGTHKTCPNAEIALNGLKSVTRWLKEHNARGLLGEFGGSLNSACLSGLEDMVTLMDQSPEQWFGWTYWAAGDWWPEDEGNNIQPTAKGDRPQLAAIMHEKYVSSDLACSTIN